MILTHCCREHLEQEDWVARYWCKLDYYSSNQRVQERCKEQQ